MKVVGRKSPLNFIHFFYTALLNAALLLTLASAHADTTVSVRMCYEEQQLEPYFMGTGPIPPRENPGIFIEMLNMLNNELINISVDFHRAPWKRCLNEIKQGKTDVLIASYDNDREALGIYPMKEKQVDISLSISSASYCLFTSRDSELSWSGSTFNFIPTKPFAVPQGYSIISLLEKHDMPIVLTNSSVAALDLLAKKRVEAAATYCESGAHYLFQHAEQKTGIIARSPVLNHREAYLVFSKSFWSKHANEAQQIWRTAASLRDSEFPRLLNKYEALR